MTAPAYQLVLRAGPTPGSVFALEKGNLFIGRDLGNDIVINDAEVSRRHARLVMQGDSFVLEDLGSTNGTSVNGQRLTGPCLLKGGDTITFGEKIILDFELVLTSPSATVIAPRPVQAVPQAYVPPAPQPAAPPPPQSYVPPAPQSVMPPPPQPIRQAPVVPPPAYAGYVPSGPLPYQAPPRKKKFPRWLIILIVLVLVVICVCGVAAWIIDYFNWWCQIPLLSSYINCVP